MAETKKMTLAQRMGITRTVTRPTEESDIQMREDRIGRYFRKYLDKFIFVEFSDAYLEKSKVKSIMKGVPIPLRKQDIKKFDGGNGLDASHIGENMAWVMGSDPKFKYTKKYVEFLKKLFNTKIDEGILKEGRDAAEKGDYDNACIHFRAALCMSPGYLHAMYSYARVCRAMYMESDDTEYIGRFKAEALDWFELLTETHPRFANGYYYLGYAYLNMGLYAKADAAWGRFMNFGRNGKDRREISKRRKQIKDPVRIEAACNDIAAGRMEQGLEVLEPFLDTQFKSWWPMHYYLGLAYKYTGRTADAVARFKHALTLNASHLETMKELLGIYKQQNDKENVVKYTKKIAMIEADIAQEQAQEEKKKQAIKGSAKGKAIKKIKSKDAKHASKEEKDRSKKATERTKAGIKRLQ